MGDSTQAIGKLSQARSVVSHALLRFLTPRRIWSYPLLTLSVLLCVGVYDRLSGDGLRSGIGPAFGGDFLSFYTGGSFMLRGTPGLLGDRAAQLAFQRQVLQSPVDGVALWVSPPFFAWLFVPLARLPYVWAFLVMVGVSVAALALALRRLRLELSYRTTTLRMLWIAVQYYPTLEWLLNGQTTGLWSSLFIWIFVLLRRDRDLAAGLLLGCFACKPQLALGLVAALLAARRWRALGGGALSALGWVSFGFLTTPDAMQSYLRHGATLVAVVRDAGYHRVGLHGSFEFATLLLDGVAPKLAAIVGCLLVLLVLGSVMALWIRSPWQPKTRAWDLRMAATFALGVIASPHLYNYDLALLILPLFIAVAHCPPQAGRALGGGGFLLTTALVGALGLVGPAWSIVQEFISQYVLGFPVVLQVGVVAIAVWAYEAAKLARRLAPNVATHGSNQP